MSEDAAPSEVDAGDAGDAAEAGDASAPPLLFRLAVNGPAHQGVDYPGAWAASPVPGVCGPQAYANPAPLHGTRDAPLFQGEAFGNPAVCALGGSLAVGFYRVRLYFAEVYFGAGCPGGGGVGSRVFDIVLEGSTVLTNFDVLAASGGCLASPSTDAGAPVVRSFDVFVADGTINLALPSTRDNGKVSAIEVFGPL